MALPVTIPGATANNIPGATANNSLLFSKRQTKLATGRLSAHINRSTTNPNIPQGITSHGTDTVFAGTPSLLISMGGVDTLGSGRAFLQFPNTNPGGTGQKFGVPANTLTGGNNGTFAAGGNQTLLGGGHTGLTPANPNPTDSTQGATQAIATVFGAAMPANVLLFDQPPPALNQPNISVAGSVPDLLLGQSFGQPGITLEFGGGHKHGGAQAAQLRDGTEVRISGLPQQGVIEIILPK